MLNVKSISGRLNYTILFYSWLALMLALSSYPTLGSSGDSFWGEDKLAHFIFYFVLTALLFKMLKQKQKKLIDIIKFAMIFSFVFPILDEMHQIPIRGRSFSWYDCLFDFVGTWIIIIYYSINYLRRKKRNEEQ